MKKKSFLAFLSLKVAEIWQEWQRRLQENSLRDVDRETKEIYDFGESEGGTDFDVEIFASNEEEEDEEEEDSNNQDIPSAGVRWLNTLGEIDIEEFTIPHGLTKDLGDGVTSKDFLNLSLTMITRMKLCNACTFHCTKKRIYNCSKSVGNKK